jgi:hypothetical protein
MYLAESSRIKNSLSGNFRVSWLIIRGELCRDELCTVNCAGELPACRRMIFSGFGNFTCLAIKFLSIFDIFALIQTNQHECAKKLLKLKITFKVMSFAEKNSCQIEKRNTFSFLKIPNSTEHQSILLKS